MLHDVGPKSALMLAEPAATVKSMTGTIETLGPDVVDAPVIGRWVIDPGHRSVTSVDGHQDLPGDGHEREAVASTGSDRIRWSWYRWAVPIAESGVLAMSSRLVARPNRRSCLRDREGGSRYLRPRDKDATMPELLIDFITSLDGYAAAEGWPGWWGLEGPEYLAWLAEQPEADYTVLMGATTYRVMSGYAAEGEPGTDALAGLSKVVFSTTLSEPLSWANTQLVAQDPVEAVREMKDKASKSMRTIGSLTLCRSLLKAGLADRFRVVVFPVITGSSGRERIYDGYPDVALDMISSRTFDGRIQLLEYAPTVLAGPPGTSGASA